MKISIKIFFIILFLFVSSNVFSQNVDSLNNQNLSNDTIPVVLNDSLNIDTLVMDSIPSTDTIGLEEGKENLNIIKEPIDFQADDSMYISVVNKQIILFGNAKLVTMGMNLGADSIGVDMKNKDLLAIGSDSLGQRVGNPVFNDGDQQYITERMKYNFDSKKGVVYNVMTQQQSGYLHGEIVKIHSTDEMHIFRGKYTTCNAKHPHFYIDLSKAKLKSKDKLITGPLWFVVADIPIPVIAPFGFLPLSQKNTSGLRFPSYVDELDRGFGLIGGGYYLAINDYIDLDITGDIYTKGSWGINLKSNIKKRYLFSSSVALSFFHYQNGLKILETTDMNNSFSAVISYNQDGKFRPNSSFSMSINYSYGNFNKLNSKNIDQFVTTTQNSSASYSKSFSGTPFRMSVSMNMTHDLRDSTTNLRFPTMSFNMSNIYPFKPVKNAPKGRWYEKLTISFTSQLANTVTANDSVFFKNPDSLLTLTKAGFQYASPFQTNLTVLKYFNINPSFNYTGRIYSNKIVKNYISTEDTNYVDYDTLWGFNHLVDFNFSVSMNTKLYGLFKLNLGPLKAIRHTFAPSISYVYKPDFGESKWGYYDLDPSDTTGKQYYSFYDNMVFGRPDNGEQQQLNFSIGNNFDAKVGSKKDTITQTKKIQLLNIGLGGNYNFAKDSLKLSNISLNASTNLFQKINVSYFSAFSPYVVDSLGRVINKYEWTVNRNPARMISQSLTFNSQISSSDFAPKDKKSDFSWSTDISYSLRYSKNFNKTKQNFEIDMSQTLGLRFNIVPTAKWRVSVSTGYDFDSKKVTSTQFDFYRDLHCWEMSLMVVPFGQRKSYMFNIKVKDPMFDAIKLKKERSWLDN